MLATCGDYRYYALTQEDLDLFDRLLPYDHPLQDLFNLIDWERLAGGLQPYFSDKRGCPSLPPILWLKLEYLRCHYRLSDREVCDRASTDIAFRWYLQLPFRCDPPSASGLCRFRSRLGLEGYQSVFDEVVRLAREQGLIKDRMRLKDASHVIACVAIPVAVQLLGQLRDRLLCQIDPIAPEISAGFRVAAAQIREETRGQKAETQLPPRIQLLQDILEWIDEEKPTTELSDAWSQLVQTRQLAEKVLRDKTNPKEPEKIVSLVDTDAHRGRHGDYYDGYKVDILVDADSRLITQIMVLSPTASEAESAYAMLSREQEIYENDIENVSIDGAGWNGEILEKLESPEGLNIKAFVPPRRSSNTKYFANTEFELSADNQSLTCPAGKTSTQRNVHKDGKRICFRFPRTACETCLLLSACMKGLKDGDAGRSVTKSHFENSLDRMRRRSKGEEYKSVRHEHPAVERTLNDVMNRCDGRHARYRGQPKVNAQQLLCGTVSNIKQMVRLLLRGLSTEC